MSVCKTWFFIDTMITYFKYVVCNFFFIFCREESFPYKGKGTWSDFNLKQLRGISHYKFLCLETKSFVRILCEMANKHTTNVLRHTQQNIQVKHFIFFWIIIKNIYVGKCELVTNIKFYTNSALHEKFSNTVFFTNAYLRKTKMNHFVNDENI